MAEKKKQPTKEEIEENEQNIIKSLEDNLKNSFYLNILGSNTLRNEHSLYGELAENIGQNEYLKAMNSKEGNGVRQNIHSKLIENEEKERNELGIADMPEVPYPTNYQLTKYVLGILKESTGNLPIGDLEKIVGETAKGAKFQVPEELKQYEEKRKKIIQNGQIEGKKYEEIVKMLDRDSEVVLQQYRNVAYETLKRGTAYKLLESHKYDDINSAIEKISQSYKKAKGIEEQKTA
jgi:hypothetical protein